MGWALALAAIATTVPARADEAADTAALLTAIRSADLRLATIAYRLASANVALCDRRQPMLGVQFHSIDQYAPDVRATARATFRFETPLAVAGVVADAPAARAGMRQDDSVERIGKRSVAPASAGPASTDTLQAIDAVVAALPPEAPIELALRRDGRARTVTVQPVAGCRSRFEMRLTEDIDARADGDLVQVPSRFFEGYPDDEIAALVAHELAHNILHHRERLQARGVDFGMLAGFGANVRYFRQTEIEADLLSVVLLANAGYDPRAATRYWNRFGPSLGPAVLRSRTHPAWRDRVATMEREIARIETMSVRPIVPPLIATRDRPLDGDWQSLLVRAAR